MDAGQRKLYGNQCGGSGKEYGSVLNYYKRLIRFRKSAEYKEILTYGSYEPIMEDQDHNFAYERKLGGKKTGPDL